MQRLCACGCSTPSYYRIAGLHQKMNGFRISLEVAIELGMEGPPVDEPVVGVLVAAADDNGLAPVGMGQKFRKQVEMVVRPVPSRG